MPGFEDNAPAPKDLSDEQKERITLIQNVLAEVNNTSLEETLENFKKDINPASEIEIWEMIAGVYQQILKQKPTSSFEERNEIYRLLLLRSNMSSEEVLEQYHLTTLSLEEAKQVLDLYEMDYKPFLIVKNDR
jgi:DNA polymerase III delta prime subunit